MAEWLNFHYNNRGGGQFSTLTFDPIILLYFIYHDLKVKIDQKANISFQGGRRGQFSTLIFDPKIVINFTYCDFKVKTEEITCISIQQGIGVNSQPWNETPCIKIY